MSQLSCFVFFFQAEDGIRDDLVTGVQTCALPLWYEFLRDLPEKFTRQKPLGSYIGDFYCTRVRLVIEIDGESHFTEVGERHDASRTAAQQAGGLHLVRFTNAEGMQQFEAVCQRIRQALAEKS